LEVEEKAGEAEALLNNATLRDAFIGIHSRAVGILAEAEVGSLTAGGAHAIIKALDEVEAQLEQYVADNKLRQKYHKGDK